MSLAQHQIINSIPSSVPSTHHRDQRTYSAWTRVVSITWLYLISRFKYVSFCQEENLIDIWKWKRRGGLKNFSRYWNSKRIFRLDCSVLLTLNYVDLFQRQFALLLVLENRWIFIFARDFVLFQNADLLMTLQMNRIQMFSNLMIECGLFEKILRENCFKRDFNLYYRFFDDSHSLTNWVAKYKTL